MSVSRVTAAIWENLIKNTPKEDNQVDESPKSALIANKVKGNIRLNIIDLPGFGDSKEDTIEDLAIVTGAKVINESLGDDIELLDDTCLGQAVKSVTSSKKTV